MANGHQLAVQRQRALAGLCRLCGGPLNRSRCRCDACLERDAESRRRRSGYQPWEPGGRGRPPKRRAVG